MNFLTVIWQHTSLELIVPIALVGFALLERALAIVFIHRLAEVRGLQPDSIAKYLAEDLRWPSTHWLRLTFLLGDLPDYRSRWKISPFGWIAPLVAAALTVTVVIAYVGFVEARLEPLKEARTALINRVPYCASDTRAGYCYQLIGSIATKVFAARKGFSGEFELLLVLGALVVALTLLLAPHLVLRILNATSLDKPTKTIFLNRAQLATLLELILMPPLLWLFAHSEATVMEGGYSVAEIASAVLSPLTLDLDQHLRGLGTLVPSSQRGELFLAVGQIKNALYLVAALSAFILLVVFETAKNMIIKPALENGLASFKWPKPPPEDAVKKPTHEEQPAGDVSNAASKNPPQPISTKPPEPVERPLAASSASTAPAVDHAHQPPEIPVDDVGKEPPAGP